MKYKHYTRKEEKQILEAINAVSDLNLSSSQLAGHLNKLEIKTNNDKPWDGVKVHNFIYSRKEKIISTPKKEKQASPIPRAIIETLITEPSLNDRQRLNMLQAYLNS